MEGESPFRGHAPILLYAGFQFCDFRASCAEGNRAWSGLSGGAPTETGMTGHRPQASGKLPATGASCVWLQAISCGFGIVPAFFRGVGITYVSNGFPKVFDGSGMVPGWFRDGSGFGFSQSGIGFRERHPDRVRIGAARRQEQEPGSTLSSRRSPASAGSAHTPVCRSCPFALPAAGAGWRTRLANPGL